MGIEILKEEIEKIELISIREWTEKILLNVDPKFWTAPSSPTGKHHPPEDNGLSGLVKGHIKKGVIVVEEYGRRVGFSSVENCLALSAFLIHDVCKNGVRWGEGTDYTHGFIASKWIDNFFCKDGTMKKIVMDAVRYHMAPWCYVVSPFENRKYSGEEMRKNLEELQRALISPGRIELAVREADYWSSRKGMSFLPGVSALTGLKIHDAP